MDLVDVFVVEGVLCSCVFIIIVMVIILFYMILIFMSEYE